MLNISDHVLYLSFAFRIRLATKNRLKRHRPDEGLEHFGQDQVAKVLIDQQDLVLVINDLFRDAPKILEGFNVGIDRKGRSKWGQRVEHILATATGKNHGKEVYLDSFTLTISHVVLSEVNLGLLTPRKLLYNTILPLRIRYGDIVSLTDIHHKVVNGLWGYLRKIGVMLLKPVMHLRSLGIRILIQLDLYKTLKGTQQLLPIELSLNEGKKLFLAHL